MGITEPVDMNREKVGTEHLALDAPKMLPTNVPQDDPLDNSYHGQGDLATLLDRAWEVSRARHGNLLTVHVPGMFVVNGRRGRYRAVSITGSRCDLDCEHCKGSLLKTMPHAETPEELVSYGMQAAARGDFGILVTGGCNAEGKLPWNDFIPAISTLKSRTDLTVTVHAGQVDRSEATALKDAGVDQTLVDVIGDDATARDIYHLHEGTAVIRRTLDSLAIAGLEIVPHILVGLHFGRLKGEDSALEILAGYPLKKYVVVVIMPFRGTPMVGISPPGPEETARFLVRARLRFPELQGGLGCARPRGRYRRDLDLLAVRAGINSLALPSDRALDEAQRRGLRIEFRETCCSLG
jgi:lipoyl synthase